MNKNELSRIRIKEKAKIVWEQLLRSCFLFSGWATIISHGLATMLTEIYCGRSLGLIPGIGLGLVWFSAVRLTILHARYHKPDYENNVTGTVL